MHRSIFITASAFLALILTGSWPAAVTAVPFRVSAATVNQAVAADRSRPLWTMQQGKGQGVPTPTPAPPQAPPRRSEGAPAEAPKNAAGAKVEQTSMGAKPPAELAASFDGLGVGFEGPH